MRRCFLVLLVPLLLASNGCSIAAAAAGANSNTVSSLAELDGVLVGSVLGAIGSAAGAAVEEAQRPPIPDDAHMCFLDADGGVEIYALDEVHAEALCRARWGEYAVCRCEWIGGRAR